MCKYFKILALATLPLAAYASMVFASLTGIVTDTNGSPLEFATVVFTDESGKGFRDYTDGQGKYSIDLSVPTGIDASAPFVFSLGQNYPNPFNPTTVIPFTLDSREHVRLAVYTVMGQRVATVINNTLGAGPHTATWDGRDDRGNQAGAGIYLYQLSVGRQVATKKMLLLDGGGVSPAIKSSIAQHVAKSTAGATYTVTVSHMGILPYKKSGVSVSEGQTMDFAVTPKAGTTIISGLTFVPIPSGTAILGQTGYDYCDSSHAVTISKGFEMSVTEITQGQYTAIMGSNPSGFTGDDNLPVDTVDSWDAMKFCNALSRKAGLKACYDDSTWYCDFSANGFRLPTEEEWEYACRAGTATLFNLGDTESDLARAGWYGANSNRKSHPVGQKEPNAWGLYDMHGNVLEYCNDWYPHPLDQSISYGNEANPESPPITGPYKDDYIRNFRGGDWAANFLMSFSAYETQLPDYRWIIYGFRIVRRP